MARPLKVIINWEEFDKLCAFQCTEEEIAFWFGVSVDTIERRVKSEKGMNFAEYYAQKKGKGKISLRRAQFQAALGGNTALLIWLGKIYLNQKDTTKLELTDEIVDTYLSRKQTADANTEGVPGEKKE